MIRGIKRAFLIASLLTSGAAFAGTPGWSVSESSGSVTVLKSGMSQAAMRGGKLIMGDVVSTGANGRAVLVRGEEYLVVSPNSRIRIADPAASGGMTQIIQNFGNTIFKIQKKTTPHFGVQTPYLAAVVKGTTFSVTVTETGASVQVTEGRVEVATLDGAASYMVLPGDIGSVASDAPFRLKVQGHESKTIDSPNRGQAAAAAAAIAAADSAQDETQVASKDSGDKTKSFDSVIAAPVSEGPVRLDSMSGGMIGGDSSLVAVAATTTPVIKPEPTPAPPIEVAVALPVTNITQLPPVDLGLVTPDPIIVTPPPVDVVTPLPPTPVAGAPVVVTQPPVAVVTPAPAPVVTPIVVVAQPPVAILSNWAKWKQRARRSGRQLQSMCWKRLTATFTQHNRSCLYRLLSNIS
jgi:hypothetical protein